MINLLKSEKLWAHIGNLCKAFSSGVFLLRLADHANPAMDKLYYAVRKMDISINKTKALLDETEQLIESERGGFVQARMMKYYLATSGSEVNAACTEIEKDDDEEPELGDYDDEIELETEEDDELPDDFEKSDDESVASLHSGSEETEADKILRFWHLRSKKLRHDLSIAGWMCSPVEEIMQDAKEHHTGTERDAVTSLFKKWFCHEVRLTFVFYILYILQLLIIIFFFLN